MHCLKHGRPLEMFCIDCQLTVCAKCFAGDHRDHNCDFITDIIDQYQQEINDHLIAVKQQVSYVLNTIDNLSIYHVTGYARAYKFLVGLLYSEKF